jgi:putative ABC transport system substrate-binding protein
MFIKVLVRKGLKKRVNLGRVLLVLSFFSMVGMLFTGCGEKKVYRIGILSGIEFMAVVGEGFKEKMTELGYIEGENITYDVQTPVNYMEDIDRISKQFVEDKVDLIFCYPTEAALGAKKATAGTNIPVVFAVTNIEGSDLINSIREPGGNITGVRYPGPDLALKRFDIMQQLAPKAKTYWLPYHPDLPVCYPQLEALRPAAKSAGITIIESPLRDANEVEAFLKKRAEKPDFDALFCIAEILTIDPDAFLVMNKYTTKHKIPMGGVLMQVDGYSSVYGVNVKDSEAGTNGAILADKILKGTQAGTIPVISSESYFELNYKEAKKLGLDVSEGLLVQADRVIK